MSFVASTVPLNVAKILSATPMSFSSSADGYSAEELEKFSKVFRIMPSYEESISSKEFPLFLQTISYIKPVAAYQKYVDYADKVLGGRFELTQVMKYFRAQHEPRLLMSEYLANFDSNNDGYVSKEEFEFGMETIRIHDPRVKNISYANFLKEADANRDGKISVEECKNWLNKYLVTAN